MALSHFAISIFLIFLSMRSSQVFAQNTSSPAVQKLSETNNTLPKIMILPWQTPLVDADSLRLTRDARNIAFEKLKTTFISNGTTLDKAPIKNSLPKNLEQMLKSIWVDTTTVEKNAVAIIPIWTRIHDHHLVGVIVVDSFQNTVRLLNHKLLPSERWVEALKSKNFENMFTPTLTTLTQSIKTDIPPKIPEDLSVLFREQTASSRSNEIDRMTLNLLMAYQIASNNGDLQFTLINPFASTLLSAVHKAFKISTPMRKPNRMIFTRIAYEKIPDGIKLPITLNMGVSAAEAVFGKSLPQSWNDQLTVATKSDDTIELKFSDKISAVLTEEKKALQRNELPQVVKIRGAWAYVDKGRAWGLQMNDRLAISDGSGTIKGHVVGYFGPEMKLKSARGYGINEGAIIFIRKGQKLVKNGLQLTYDPMRVPSP